MTTDARYIAWFAAEQRLKVAHDLTQDEDGRVRTPLPEYYWAMIAEAAVFADLARCTMDVGLAVGTYREERDREKIRHRKNINDFMEFAEKRKET